MGRMRVLRRAATLAVCLAVTIGVTTTGPAASARTATRSHRVRIESDDPRIQLGSWISMFGPGAIGGSYRTSARPGALVVFRFDGSSVTWFGHRGPRQGLARVHIDGVDRGVVDTSFGQPGPASWSFSGLTAGPHRLSIRVMRAPVADPKHRHVSVDAFSVDGGAPLDQQEAAGISYDSWRTALDPTASGGSYIRSARVGATLTVRGILGRDRSPSWMVLFLRVSPDAGEVAWSLVDEPEGTSGGTDDLFSYHTAWLGFAEHALPGRHTLVAEVADRQDMASTGHVVGLDAIAVPGVSRD
jgi:hypothetical protein